MPPGGVHPIAYYDVLVCDDEAFGKVGQSRKPTPYDCGAGRRVTFAIKIPAQAGDSRHIEGKIAWIALPVWGHCPIQNDTFDFSKYGSGRSSWALSAQYSQPRDTPGDNAAKRDTVGLISNKTELGPLRPCCMDQVRRGTRPTRDGIQAVRSKLGRPSSVIRLSMRTPILASVF